MSDPRLPANPPPGYVANLVTRLTELLRTVTNQLDGLAGGRISATKNSSTTAPTTGLWNQGDFVRNSNPTELGSISSKYVIIGWVCTAGGEPGTWVQCRCLTGN